MKYRNCSFRNRCFFFFFFERAFEKLDARSKKPLFRRAFEKPPHVNMRLPLFRTCVFFFSFFKRAFFFSFFSNARFFSFFKRAFFSRFFQTRVFFLVFSERAFFFFVFQTRTRKRPKNANARSKPMSLTQKKNHTPSPIRGGEQREGIVEGRPQKKIVSYTHYSTE